MQRLATTVTDAARSAASAVKAAFENMTSGPASPTPCIPAGVLNMVGWSKMPPRAFQLTEKFGTLTLPPSPYDTELVETFITGILGFGIVMVIFSNAAFTALAGTQGATAFTTGLNTGLSGTTINTSALAVDTSGLTASGLRL